MAHKYRRIYPLQLPPCQPADAFQNREQVPSPIVSGKGVDLIDDDGPNAAQHLPAVRLRRNQHDLQRLRRGEQNVRRIRLDPVALRRADISVPQCAAPTHHLAVSIQPLVEIVQQRLERADIDDAQAAPILGAYPG